MSKGTVYVVVNGDWSSGDVAGTLLMDTGEAPWSHMSSSRGWLIRDLTDGFSDRRSRLEEQYPDGYDVVLVDKGDEVPADILAANETWHLARAGGESA